MTTQTRSQTTPSRVPDAVGRDSAGSCSYAPRAGLGFETELARLERQADLTFDTELAMLCEGGLGTSGTVVDLGCGSGAITRRLRVALPHARVIACDVDPGMVELVEEPRHLIVDGHIPVPPGTVDDVVIRFVAQHLLPRDRARLWAQALDLLRPGGRLHVIDVNDSDAGTVRPWVPQVRGVYAKVARLQADQGGDRSVIAKIPPELSAAGFISVRPHTATISSHDRPIEDFAVHLGPERHRGLAHDGSLNPMDLALLEHAWTQIHTSPDAFVSLKCHAVHAVKPTHAQEKS